MMVNKNKTLHNSNVFIHAYSVAREQLGLPSKPVLNNYEKLIHDKPKQPEKCLTSRIGVVDNHFRNHFLELDNLFWQGINTIAANNQEATFFRQRVFILKRFYGLNAFQMSKQVGKWGKIIGQETEMAQHAFCQSLGILKRDG
ncbi:hypothetical protein [Enterococcus gilvus]|uniref:hypothetical protein n=1 Tax=Enterococcus gilvus TaxID=160453 RepID=UPI002909CA12|nr:hypothetical protein [Enterococcus gilvus]MDU5511625.1 hypothetical protein [Enterococcus gilvus]